MYVKAFCSMKMVLVEWSFQYVLVWHEQLLFQHGFSQLYCVLYDTRKVNS